MTVGGMYAVRLSRLRRPVGSRQKIARVGAFYSTGDGKLELREYGIEDVKRLSDKWRLVAAVEGDQDEVQAIVEIQYQVRPNITIKLNTGLGLTSKAPDFAPEIGVLFSF